MNALPALFSAALSYHTGNCTISKVLEDSQTYELEKQNHLTLESHYDVVQRAYVEVGTLSPYVFICITETKTCSSMKIDQLICH
jgi:hypothetical protein